MTLLQCSVQCLYGRTRTSSHALPKCHRNARLSCLSLHSTFHNLLYPPVVAFFGSLGLFFECDVISPGLILLRFWVCVFMILGDRLFSILILSGGFSCLLLWCCIILLVYFHFYISIWPSAVISGSLSTRHGTYSGCIWRNSLQYGG